MADGEPKTANELAAERTSLAVERSDLAVERTVMAANRTLMAWVRTGLSLISFGFTIYKFLQASIGNAPIGLMRTPHGPRRFGLLLIALGTISVVMGAVEYYETIKGLNKLTDHPRKAFNFSFMMGLLIGLLGLFLFITIAAHKDVF